MVLLFDDSKEDMEFINAAAQTISNKLGYPVPKIRVISAPDYLPKFKKLGLISAENELENKIEFIINDLINLRREYKLSRMFVLPNYTWFGENTDQVFNAYSLLASHAYFGDSDVCSFIGYYGNLLDTSNINDCVNRFILLKKPDVSVYFSYLPRLYYLLFGENIQVLEHIKAICSKHSSTLRR